MREDSGFPGAQAGGASHGAGNIGDHFDSQVHLEPGESHDFLALFLALRVDFGILRFGRVAVNANLIAELSAQHLVNRNAVDLADDVPQRHLHGGYSARLTPVAAELLDLLPQVVQSEGVLSHQAALQKQCEVALAPSRTSPSP